MPAKRSIRKARLRVVRSFDVPLREVSGICLRQGKKGEKSLVAVGDRAAKIVWISFSKGSTKTIVWQTADITRRVGSRMPKDDPQLEAICADGMGNVLLLQESPPRAELIDVGKHRVVASISLEIGGDDKLARSWSDPKGS